MFKKRTTTPLTRKQSTLSNKIKALSKKRLLTFSLGFLIFTSLAAGLVWHIAFAITTGTGTVSLTSIGTPQTQDFNTLASTGTANSTLPTGWYFDETGTGANTTYRA